MRRLPSKVDSWILRQGTCAEAFVALAAARLCVAVGLRWISPFAFRPVPALPIPHRHLTLRIAIAIQEAAKLLPGETRCLPRALVGKLMLWRRGWPSTVRLGVRHDDAGSLQAHAWLAVGGEILIGADGMAGLTPLPADELLVSRPQLY